MRTIDAALLTALASDVVRTIYLVRIDFDGGTVAWNTGYRDISYGGKTYIGIGEIMSLGAVKESTGVAAAGISITIAGIKPEVVSLLLSEPYINRPVWLYHTLLDDNDVPLVANPVLLFRGSINAISGEMSRRAAFTLDIKSRLADWERPRRIRYTDAEQQKQHPGDKGLEYVAALSQRTIIWPRAAFLPDIRD